MKISLIVRGNLVDGVVDGECLLDKLAVFHDGGQGCQQTQQVLRGHVHLTGAFLDQLLNICTKIRARVNIKKFTFILWNIITGENWEKQSFCKSPCKSWMHATRATRMSHRLHNQPLEGTPY